MANTAEILEAEDASLSGPTPQARPQVKTAHRNFTGRGYVDGLGEIKAGVTFTPRVRLPGYYDVVLRAGNAAGKPGTLSVFVNGVPQGTATVPVQADARYLGQRARAVEAGRRQQHRYFPPQEPRHRTGRPRPPGGAVLACHGASTRRRAQSCSAALPST